MNTAKTIIWGATVLFGIGFCAYHPVVAHAQDVASPRPLDLSLTSDSDDSMKDLLPLRSSKHLRNRPSFENIIRHLGREWPRLLTNYVQPVVRGLVADQQGGNALAFRSTLFRSSKRGLELDSGVGRSYWGEREARLQLSLRF